jgi:hypothetical protein
MAGRNLFATEQTDTQQDGRNLFAEMAPTPIPGTAAAPSPQPTTMPDMNVLFDDYLGGRMDDHKKPYFEELMRRRLSGKSTLGISGGESQFLEKPKDVPVVGPIMETAATLASGAIAEPVAGISGIAAGLATGDAESAARAVEGTREALTYLPRTESGKKFVTSLAGFVQPVAEFAGELETKLGDAAFDATGSPALAAAATSVPTLITELLGAAAGKGALKASKRYKTRLEAGEISRAINESSPTIENLKSSANALYNEIDELGASIDSEAYFNLVDKITEDVLASGMDPDITPKATKALKRFDDLVGEEVSLSQLEKVRAVAQNAARSTEPAESMLGVKMINAVDEMLENADTTGVLTTPKHIDKENIGQRYRAARDMWGRARRSERLQEAFEAARNSASGFENGIRVEFRKILNNKKQSKFFSRDELAEIKKVVRGTKKQNMAKLIGKLGFSEGSATGIIGGTIGVGSGAAIGGIPGAVIVPLVGQVSKKLARRMTANQATFADQIIRAGKNAKKIATAYFENTPDSLRDPAELADLLAQGDISLTELPKTEFLTKAAKLASERRMQLGGVLAEATEKQEE